MSSPSIVPNSEPIYFVMCDYGPKVGRAFVETDPDAADRATIVRAIAEGQYTKVAQVLAVDLTEGTVRDVTHEIFEEAHVRAMHT